MQSAVYSARAGGFAGEGGGAVDSPGADCHRSLLAKRVVAKGIQLCGGALPRHVRVRRRWGSHGSSHLYTSFVLALHWQTLFTLFANVHNEQSYVTYALERIRVPMMTLCWNLVTPVCGVLISMVSSDHRTFDQPYAPVPIYLSHVT